MVKALEPLKAKHPDVSYADMYTFAGKVAIEVGQCRLTLRYPS
jgi:catalase (peroxidase I)